MDPVKKTSRAFLTVVFAGVARMQRYYPVSRCPPQKNDDVPDLGAPVSRYVRIRTMIQRHTLTTMLILRTHNLPRFRRLRHRIQCEARELTYLWAELPAFCIVGWTPAATATLDIVANVYLRRLVETTEREARGAGAPCVQETHLRAVLRRHGCVLGLRCRRQGRQGERRRGACATLAPQLRLLALLRRGPSAPQVTLPWTAAASDLASGYADRFRAWVRADADRFVPHGVVGVQWVVHTAARFLVQEG